MDSNASDILSDIEVDIHYTSDSDIDEEFYLMLVLWYFALVTCSIIQN